MRLVSTPQPADGLSHRGRSWQREVTDAINVPSYMHLANKVIAGQVNAAAIGTAAPTANVLRVEPFLSPARGGNLTSMSIQVTAFAAGNARLGIYQTTSESTLTPGKLVLDAGVVTTGTNGLKTLTCNVIFQPSTLYWIAHLADAAPTIQCIASVSNMAPVLGIDGSSTVGHGWFAALGYAALPDPFPAATLTGGTPIVAVLLGFSS